MQGADMIPAARPAVVSFRPQKLQRTIARTVKRGRLGDCIEVCRYFVGIARRAGFAALDLPMAELLATGESLSQIDESFRGCTHTPRRLVAAS